MPAQGRSNRKAQSQPSPRQPGPRNARQGESAAGKENSRSDAGGGNRSSNRRSSGGGRRAGAAQDKEPAESTVQLAINWSKDILTGEGDVDSRKQLNDAFTHSAVRLIREEHRHEIKSLLVGILSVGGLLVALALGIVVLVPDPFDKVVLLFTGALATLLSGAVRAYGSRRRRRQSRGQAQRGQAQPSRTEELWSLAADAITGKTDG